MTVFLCILALMALTLSRPKLDIAGDSRPAMMTITFVMLLWVLLVLGLATLALYSNSGAVPW